MPTFATTPFLERRLKSTVNFAVRFEHEKSVERGITVTSSYPAFFHCSMITLSLSSIARKMFGMKPLCAIGDWFMSSFSPSLYDAISPVFRSNFTDPP